MGRTEISMSSAEKSARSLEAAALERATAAAFVPNARRTPAPESLSFATTETCELSCVFCHFNGPNTTKKAATIAPELVERGVRQLAAGQKVYFAATGDFFQDPNALDHLRATIALGHPVNVLSHGQSMPPALIDEMLDIGVREFRFSVDHIEPHAYAKIRRGGDLARVLGTIDYLNTRKRRFPDVNIEINCILIGDTKERMEEFADFWRGRVAAVNFHAEYYDTLKFRNLFHVPKTRNDCYIQPYVLPSGQITPCCAITVEAHNTDLPWLPNIADTPLQEAYDRLCDMYEDPDSELGKICSKCQWWNMWSEMQDGATPYLKTIRFDTPRSEGFARLVAGLSIAKRKVRGALDLAV
jgi:pyruvate-formate lyase-activating enzyme